MKKNLLLLVIFLSLISTISAQLNFASHTITIGGSGNYSVYAADMDSDGDQDILGTSTFNKKILWFENDGNVNFSLHTISTDGVFSVYAIDLDDDGDMDVLSASENNNKISWYENDGNQIFTQHTITTYAEYAQSANFRKENPGSFKETFRYFVALLRDWKLIEGKTIAIDSFKIRAQNSLKNNFNERKVKRHLDYIDKKIAEYEGELDKEFNQEIEDKLARVEKKKESYQEIRQSLKESGDGQMSTTDPDSRAVVFQRNSVKVGYNIQAASDSKHKLLIAADTGDVIDTKSLALMVEKVQDNLDMPLKKINVLADKGYHSGRELKACEELNVKS